MSDILDTPMRPNDAGATTVGQYLAALFKIVWDQGEDAIKRPFGNSGWQYEVYEALVRAGTVPGKLDEDGHLDEVNDRAADKLIDQAIVSAFAPPPAPVDNRTRVRTYYRAVLIDSGQLWCESRIGSDVIESRRTAPGPVRLEKSHTYEVDDPWTAWTPDE